MTIRWSRIVGISLALAVAVLAAVAASVDAGWMKDRLARAVEEKKQRRLTIEGDAELSLWPNLGVRLGKVALSEFKSSEEFAAADGARLSVALWPLLSGRIVADTVELSGLRARLVKRRDGSLNIDDLLAPDAESGPLQLRVAGVRIAEATLAWHDEAGGKTTTLAGIGLDTGPIEADTGAGTYRLDSLALTARLAGGDPVDLRLTGSGIEATREGLKAGALALDVDAAAGDGALKLRLASPLTANLERRSVVLDRLEGRLEIADPRLPMKTVKLPLTGQLRADLAKGSAQGNLAARLDDSRIALRVDVSRFSPPSLGFNLDIDQLDLDRYLPAAASAGSGRPGASGGRAEVSALAGVDLRGLVTIGRLHMAGIRTTNLRLKVTMRGGKLEYGDLAGEAVKAKVEERLREKAAEELRGLFGR